MRYILIGLLCASAWGQSPVVVTGPLKMATAEDWTGDLTVSWPSMKCGTTPVVKGSRTFRVTNGVVPTIQVYPTASCGNNRYTINYTGGTIAYWTIPTTPSSQSILSIETLTTPALPVIPPFAIGQGSGLQAALDSLALLIPGSAVPSVFGRTGPITASSGDYSTYYEAKDATILKSGGSYSDPSWLTLSIAKTTGLQSALDLKAPLASPTFTGTMDATGATATRPIKTGTSMPSPCSTGDVFFKTDATAGSNVFTCISNAWTVISSGEVATAGAGLVKVATEFSVDDTQFLGYSTDTGEPTGIGAVGEMYIRTSNHSLYLGTGTGWSLVTATASVTPSSNNGDIYLTNDAGAAAWGGISVSSGLTKAFAGSTITLALDSAVVPTKAGDNTWTGKRIVTPTAEQVLVAGTAVVAAQVAEVSAAADVTLTGTPTIADGTAGEFVTLLNVGGPAITFQDETQLTGSNLSLAGRQNFILLGGNAMQLIFSSTAGAWIQMGGGAITAAQTTWDNIVGNMDDWVGNFDDWTKV